VGDKSDQPEPHHVFVATDDGPPKRRFWIYHDGPSIAEKIVRGWRFVFDEEAEDGSWEPGHNPGEEWFFEIMRYPQIYASRPLVWRRECDNEIVVLEELQPLFDGKIVLPDESAEAAGLQSAWPAARRDG
jgi:hypothetical protein